MMSFFTRYIIIAIVLTSIVYYGAPMAAKQLAQRQGDATASSQGGIAAIPGEAPRHIKPQRVEKDQSRPPLPPRARSIEEIPPPAVAVAPPPAPANPVYSAETVLSYTPSTARIPTSSGDVTHWGVTEKPASLYERNGKRLERQLPGGVLVEQVGTGNSSLGEVALCLIWEENRWQGPWLIDAANLFRFAGRRDEVDADELELLLRYCDLNGKIEERRQEILKGNIGDNPHFAPLRDLKLRYDASAARAKKLTAERDTAQGAERGQIADQLRQLKDEEVRLRRQIEELTVKYEDWKRGNARPSADPSQDARIKALTAARQRLLPQLGNFGL